jgi:hypothetical protein
MARGQEKAGADGLAKSGQGSIVCSASQESWAYTSYDVQPGDIVCSIGSWGHLIVVIRLNKENSSFTLIRRAHMAVWSPTRRGLSVIPESDAMEEVGVLEGKTSPLILGRVFELQLSNQLILCRMGPGWRLPLWSRRKGTVSIDSIIN